MKKQYSGLTTERVTVVCESPLMVGSIQKIKAKTKVQDWQTEDKEVEFGIGDELSGDLVISNTTP